MAAVTVKTVKESVSGRLSGLKFMQRAKIREEEFKKQEVEVAGDGVADDSHWVAPAAAAARTRCKVIVEGDPKPGAVIGRMSFQNCNPTVDGIVEEVLSRRERMRDAASTSNGKEVKPVVSTPQPSANGVEERKLEQDVENLSMRKRQKVEKVEKLTVTQNREVEVGKATVMKTNSFTALRGSKNENDRRQQQPQQLHRESKQVNSRTDWRNLRPPGR
ncbi:hypothetical protein KC19_10G152300 [Ceratodon purpureus]|uniref:Uncharacterized protein n=1 Tax=Ceratodon purpureus TaxID=3225 RepID=A0A8T0GM31_CERPU|nr:hypothetical protein KC19_10G152300 [Ceratodon purpureus]